MWGNKSGSVSVFTMLTQLTAKFREYLLTFLRGRRVFPDLMIIVAPEFQQTKKHTAVRFYGRHVTPPADTRLWLKTRCQSLKTKQPQRWQRRWVCFCSSSLSHQIRFFQTSFCPCRWRKQWSDLRTGSRRRLKSWRLKISFNIHIESTALLLHTRRLMTPEDDDQSQHCTTHLG